MLIAIDIFLTIFHVGITLFNTFGWMHPRTRKAHLLCLITTLVSWLGFGLFYGLGYCFLTDWHYQILEKRGFDDLPYSFITFVIERFFEVKLNDAIVVDWTMYGMIVVVLLTLFFNVRDYLKQLK